MKLFFKIGYNILAWVILISLLFLSGIVQRDTDGSSGTINLETILSFFAYASVHLFLPIYFHHLVLIKKLFYKSRLVLYVISVFLLVTVVTVVSYFAFETSIFITFVTTILALIIGAGFFMSKEALTNKLQLEDEKESQVEMKMKLLQEQVNPHFLYNVLNSIYNLAMFKPKLMPGVILKLSDLFRYSLESAKEQNVSLLDEIKFIDNYIDLQRLRLEKTMITWEKNINQLQHLYIAPMLLITFIENSFKHGAQATVDNSYINLKISTQKSILFFSIKNNAMDNGLENTSRIGLKNVKKRLQLIYPNRHKLTITKTLNSFQVNLEIQL